MRKEKDWARPQLRVTSRCSVPRRGAIRPHLRKASGAPAGLLVLGRGLRGLARPEPSATRASGGAPSRRVAFSSEPRVCERAGTDFGSAVCWREPQLSFRSRPPAALGVDFVPGACSRGHRGPASPRGWPLGGVGRGGARHAWRGRPGRSGGPAAPVTFLPGLGRRWKVLEGNGAPAAQEGAAHPLGSRSREGSAALGQRWKGFPPPRGSRWMGRAVGRGRLVVAVAACLENPELCRGAAGCRMERHLLVLWLLVAYPCLRCSALRFAVPFTCRILSAYIARYPGRRLVCTAVGLHGTVRG